MKIQFFDVSDSQELAHLNGQILTFDELSGYHLKLRHNWPRLAMERESFCLMNFHPYGVGSDGWKSWALHFTTAVQLISGHTPTESEIKVVREYIRRLPHEFKRTKVDQRFVLCFVPYLFVGFKASTVELFTEESNNIMDLGQFTTSLSETSRVVFSSFLCAHRDAAQDGRIGLLQEVIPAYRIRKAIALVMGLAHNVSDTLEGSAVFLQQQGSVFASSSIFPEVTIDYLEKGNMSDMIACLDRQTSIVKEVLNSFSTSRVKPKMVSLDVLTRRIARHLDCHYGLNWRDIDFTSSEYDEDPVVQIAVNMALPDIKRLMPFFSGNSQPRFILRKDELIEKNQAVALVKNRSTDVKLVVQAIEWFVQQHSMTLSAKAVYETVFYYLWGRYCAMNKGAFAIGFDRDHARFQHFAWKLGAEEAVEETTDMTQLVPLYARRNPNGRKHGALIDLSFRQFWR